MKFSTIATIITATVGVAAASPALHKHLHHHPHKRTNENVNVVNVYVLNGQQISEAEVQQGLDNGTLVLDNGAIAPVAAPVVAPVAEAAVKAPKVEAAVKAPKVQAAAESSPISSAVASPKASPSLTVTLDNTNEEKSKAPKLPEPSTAPADDSSELSDTTAPVSNGVGSFSHSSTGLDSEFPSGEVSCSTFPSKYGAMAVPYLGKGGWTGIQVPESTAAGFANILTKITGGDCSEGSYCSYACPPGYQKSQWPETQGATGQSIGGLLCKNGKLELTNPSLSKSLCMKGTSQVNVQVKNTMSEVASVCRTDYPGTEGETIPLQATAGSTTPLTCPEGDNYYMWDNKITSAQYYVNPKGVDVQDACQWGSPDNDWGNYAPMNLGVGYSNGAAWLSIFQNQPTTQAKLDYTVELVGDNGGFDNFVGRCKYSKGQYCSGDNYENCSSSGAGCTVNVKSGTATFVFSD